MVHLMIEIPVEKGLWRSSSSTSLSK